MLHLYHLMNSLVYGLKLHKSNRCSTSCNQMGGRGLGFLTRLKGFQQIKAGWSCTKPSFSLPAVYLWAGPFPLQDTFSSVTPESTRRCHCSLESSSLEPLDLSEGNRSAAVRRMIRRLIMSSYNTVYWIIKSQHIEIKRPNQCKSPEHKITDHFSGFDTGFQYWSTVD